VSVRCAAFVKIASSVFITTYPVLPRNVVALLPAILTRLRRPGKSSKWSRSSDKRHLNPRKSGRSLTIGSGPKFPAVGPDSEIPGEHEGQRSAAAPGCLGFFDWGSGGRRFESGHPDQFLRVFSGPWEFHDLGQLPETSSHYRLSMCRWSGVTYRIAL